MANNHQHGAFGVLRFRNAADDAWFDVSASTTTAAFNQAADLVEDTGMSPTGGKKTHLLGLAGATTDFTMLVPKAGEALIGADALVRARQETAFEYYPFGMVDSSVYFHGNVLFTNPGSVSQSTGGAITSNFAATFTGDVTEELYYD